MKKFIFGLLFLTFAFSCLAYHKISWHNWVEQIRQEAISQGIRPSLFDRVFDGMTPSAAHIQLDRSQPEKRITYLHYRNSRGNAYRIKMGQKEFKKYSHILNEIGHEYGVDPCYITSIWGLETSYGRFMGNYPVIRSLATLAYDSRRSEFFTKELFYALHILNDGHVDPKKFKGEWAGASGHPQFLPSSWNHYAVDYNNDGHKDIWNTMSDVFASMANYLASNGWQYNQPCLIKVSVPKNISKNLLGLKVTKTAAEWKALGVTPEQNVDPNLDASIVYPDGGPYLMVFNNFKTLMTWNRSIYYAGTVDYMARKICAGS